MNATLAESIAAAVAAHADAQPDAIALLAHGRAPCSYRALSEHLERTRATLSGHLGAHNRTIAVALANGPDLLTALVAAMSSGLCAPVDAARPGDEIDAFLGDVRPALVVADAACIARHGAVFARYGVCVVQTCALDGAAGVFDLALHAAATNDPGESIVDDADAVLLVRTSGTTSASKIVPHTMSRLMHIIEAVIAAVELRSTDRCLNARPLHHLHAIVHVVGASLVAGASVACPPDAGGAALVAGFRSDEPTWYSASPPVHRDIVALAKANGGSLVHTLRFVRSSSASLDPGVARDLEAALGVPVLQGYGMSEAPSIALNPLPPMERKAGSVGRAIGGEVRIADEDGRILAAGCVGEVVIRGANVAPAYAGADARPILDPVTGWFQTGDSGTIDADGYVFLTGRFNELINVGGEKVAPGTVEGALRSHPAVADAVVFPLPHATLGERVAAAVIVHSDARVDARELIAHAAQRLSRHAVPSVVHVVDAIARDGNGKVQRRALTAAFANEPDTPPATSVAAGTKDDSLRHILSRLWEEILERPAAGIDEDFFAAGGDSLRAMRMLASIESSLAVALPVDIFLSASTIDELARAVIAEGRRTNPSRLIALRASGTRQPLVFFDGDINGGGLYARFLLASLHPDQPVYVLRPNGVHGDAIPATIEAMADADAAFIAREIPSVAYRLAGYCNGGVIAFEVARRLEARGAAVDVVALLASSATNARLEPLRRLASLASPFAPADASPELYRPARRIVNRLRAGSLTDALGFVARGAARRIGAGLRAAARPVRIPAPRDTASQLVAGGRDSADYLIYEDRLLRYFPKRYGRTIDLVWADDDEPRIPGDPTMGWRHVAQVRRRSVAGDHTTMLTDHVGELGRAVRAIFDAADRLAGHDGSSVASKVAATAESATGRIGIRG